MALTRVALAISREARVEGRRRRTAPVYGQTVGTACRRGALTPAESRGPIRSTAKARTRSDPLLSPRCVRGAHAAGVSLWTHTSFRWRIPWHGPSRSRARRAL
jgi:hypothetical protein